MMPIVPDHGGCRACRSHYRTLKQDIVARGLDRAAVQQSTRLDCSRRGSVRVVKVRAYKPTGVALGFPLPDQTLTHELSRICERLDEWLRKTLGRQGPCLAYVPPQAYHVTVVNRDHFDVRTQAPRMHYLSRRERRSIDRAITDARSRPISIRFSGLLLTRTGRLLVVGYPVGERLFQLKRRLCAALPVLEVHCPQTAHVKIAHLLVTPSGGNLTKLLRWIAAAGRTIAATEVFHDCYTPRGRVGL